MLIPNLKKSIMNCYPLVSVIIPNYNHAPFLKERIDSVLNQSYRNFEVILLDDYSTDNSREIIESYRGHEKISHIEFNTMNSGSTFKQWEKGINIAKGEWIWIAESDDVAHNNFLSILTQYLTDNASIVFCRSQIITENGEKLDEFNPSNNEVAVSFDLKGDLFVEQNMILNNSISNASSVIFSRNKYLKEVSIPPYYKLSGDYLAYLQLSKNSNVIFESRALNFYRIHSNTVRNRHVNKTPKEAINNVKFLIKNYPYIKKQIFDKWIFNLASNEYQFERIIDQLMIYYFLFKEGKLLYYLKSKYNNAN